MPTDREKCLQAGMNDYVSKPVDPQHLIFVIEKWLKPILKNIDQDSSDTVENQPAVLLNQDGLLAKLDGDIAAAREIIEMFCQEMPKCLSQLKTGLSARDTESVQSRAHYAKGMAGNICSPGLQNLFEQIEQAGRSGDLRTIEHLLDQAESQFLVFQTNVEHSGLMPSTG